MVQYNNINNINIYNRFCLIRDPNKLENIKKIVGKIDYYSLNVGKFAGKY